MAAFGFFHFVRLWTTHFFQLLKKYITIWFVLKNILFVFSLISLLKIRYHFFKFFWKIYSFITIVFSRSFERFQIVLFVFLLFIFFLVFIISQKFSKLIKLTPSSFISEHVKGYRWSLVPQLNKLRNTLTLLFAAPEPDCFGWRGNRETWNGVRKLSTP